DGRRGPEASGAAAGAAAARDAKRANWTAQIGAVPGGDLLSSSRQCHEGDGSWKDIGSVGLHSLSEAKFTDRNLPPSLLRFVAALGSVPGRPGDGVSLRSWRGR